MPKQVMAVFFAMVRLFIALPVVLDDLDDLFALRVFVLICVDMC